MFAGRAPTPKRPPIKTPLGIDGDAKRLKRQEDKVECQRKARQEQGNERRKDKDKDKNIPRLVHILLANHPTGEAYTSALMALVNISESCPERAAAVAAAPNALLALTRCSGAPAIRVVQCASRCISSLCVANAHIPLRQLLDVRLLKCLLFLTTMADSEVLAWTFRAIKHLSEHQGSIPALAKAGFVVPIVKAMGMEDQQQIRFRAIGAAGNFMFHHDEAFIAMFIANGVLKKLEAAVKSGHAPTRMKAFWTVSNIAGCSPNYTKLICQTELVGHALRVASTEDEETKIRRHAVWTLANLLYNAREEQLVGQLVAMGLPEIFWNLLENKDMITSLACLTGLTELTQMPKHKERVRKNAKMESLDVLMSRTVNPVVSNKARVLLGCLTIASGAQ